MLAQTGAGRIEAIEAGLFSTGIAAAMDAAHAEALERSDLDQQGARAGRIAG